MLSWVVSTWKKLTYKIIIGIKKKLHNHVHIYTAIRTLEEKLNEKSNYNWKYERYEKKKLWVYYIHNLEENTRQSSSFVLVI